MEKKKRKKENHLMYFSKSSEYYKLDVHIKCKQEQQYKWVFKEWYNN